MPQRASFAVHDKIVIVAAGISSDFGDARSDRDRLAKIERRARDRADLARWNQRRIHRCVSIRVQLEHVPENVSAAAKIKIAVIGQVQRSWLVRPRRVFNFQFVVMCERVRHAHGKISGVAFFAISTHIRKAYGRGAGVRAKVLHSTCGDRIRAFRRAANSADY